MKGEWGIPTVNVVVSTSLTDNLLDRLDIVLETGKY
jgi:hypothetical protein